MGAPKERSETCTMSGRPAGGSSSTAAVRSSGMIVMTVLRGMSVVVRGSCKVTSVDDPATAEFFPRPLSRQGVRMLFAQDPATLVQDIGVAGLRFRGPRSEEHTSELQ